jgi:cysteine desulfurase
MMVLLGRLRGGACLSAPQAAPWRRLCRRGMALFSYKGREMDERPIYLDMQSTTPMDKRVLQAMIPYFTESFGNPHSTTHLYGWESAAAVEKARAHLAELIGADPREIVFTSGATESNNTILKGIARFYSEKKKHIVTLTTEHKCVLDSCRHLQREGFDVSYLPVQPNGLLDLQQLKDAIRPDTSLVSIMHVNNEIGVVQDLEAIGNICRERGVFFHTDAAQGVGKIPLDVNALNIDAMSISGHKFYGPKGVGAMYVRRRPRVRLEPLISGGGQERGLRSGTLPTPLCVGIGEAARIANLEMDADRRHIEGLSSRLYDGLLSKLDHIVLNGDKARRWPGNLNFSFAYVEGESLLMGLKQIAVSSGSACTSASLEPSYVLRALGVSEELAHTSIRFGIGRTTTEAEIDQAIELTVREVNRLRELSPLWEMMKEGVDLKKVEWSQH